MSDLIRKAVRALKHARLNSPAQADYGYAEARAVIGIVAEWIKPKEQRPCDCTSCYCGNTGDAEAVISWDADNWRYKRLVNVAEGGHE